MNDLQKQVDQTKARIKAEDDTINGIQQAGGKVTAEATRLREEIKNLEATIEKCEEDKNTNIMKCYLFENILANSLIIFCFFCRRSFPTQHSSC